MVRRLLARPLAITVIAGTSFKVLVTAIFAFPRLSTFADHEPNNPQGSHRVHPPGTDEELCDKCPHDDEGEPAARDALNCIYPKGTAPKRVGEQAACAGPKSTSWE